MMKDRSADAGLLFDAAGALASALRVHDTTRDYIVRLLLSAGALSTEPAPSNAARNTVVIGSALDRLAQLAVRSFPPILQFAVNDDGDHLAAIARLFLEKVESYTIQEVASLWRVTTQDVLDVFDDEYPEQFTASAIPREHVVRASVRFTMLRPFDIERALGPRFARVRPETWRTSPVVIHIPKFIATASSSSPSIGPDASLELRIERLILDIFASRAPDRSDEHDEA